MTVEYKADEVLTAARKRVAEVFDHFERVVVSVSGGKDSTVIRHLCMEEAARRGRRVTLFFLDQEAEYQSTIDLMTEWMSDPAVDREWYQVPIRMTNATSHRSYFLYAWGPGEEWIRPKSPLAIHELAEAYPQRFYDFFPWAEQRAEVPTAFVVGFRSKESFNRFRAVTKQAGCHGWSWSTKTPNPTAFRVYPIYDWTFGDVWKYILDHGLRYNVHYDRMFAKHGVNMSRMRVSNLIHERSFRCLADLQEFEPETYDRMVRRLGGVHCAALYAREGYILEARELPAGFPTWCAYRDYLLDTTPIDQLERFRKRFARQVEDDEEVCRQQVKQILINDWEGSVPVASPQGTRRAKLRERLWDVL